MTSIDLLLFADGSSLGNPGPAGWAYRVTGTDGFLILEGAGGNGIATNNSSELLAVIRGLEACLKLWKYYLDYRTLKVVTDSKYAIGCIEKRKKFLLDPDRPNIDKIRRIDELLDTFSRHGVTIDTEWVRGHAACAQNNVVDSAARKEAMKEKEKQNET